MRAAQRCAYVSKVSIQMLSLCAQLKFTASFAATGKAMTQCTRSRKVTKFLKLDACAGWASKAGREAGQVEAGRHPSSDGFDGSGKRQRQQGIQRITIFPSDAHLSCQKPLRYWLLMRC